MSRSWVRNVVVVMGAAYLCWMLAFPIIWGFGRLTGGHIYTGDSGALMLDLVGTVPPMIVGILVGLVAGYTLETLNPHPWAVFAALWMGLSRIWAHHWFHSLGWVDVAGVVLEVLLTGAAAGLALLYFYRRANRPRAVTTSGLE